MAKIFLHRAYDTADAIAKVDNGDAGVIYYFKDYDFVEDFYIGLAIKKGKKHEAEFIDIVMDLDCIDEIEYLN